MYYWSFVGSIARIAHQVKQFEVECSFFGLTWITLRLSLISIIIAYIKLHIVVPTLIKIMFLKYDFNYMIYTPYLTITAIYFN